MLEALLLFAQNEPNPAKDTGPLGPLISLAPFILVFILFYVLIILPAQRREKKQREAIFSNLKKNDRVVTSAGIIGVVSSIKDTEDEVTLRLEEGRMRVLKSSIVKIMTDTPAGDPKTQEGIKTP